MPGKRILNRLIALAAAGSALSLGIAAVVARVISGPKRPTNDYSFTPFEVGAIGEPVTFTSADGVQVAGWWFDRDQSPAPRAEDVVVICCHGFRGSKADLLGIGPGLWRAGNSVLLFDFRGNGGSGDGPQSLGYYEQADLLAAVDYVAQQRPSAKIVVVGFSMGAAVAILVAARDPRIAALLLDSPFAASSDVIVGSIRRANLPAPALMPLIDLVTGWRYGYRFADVEPITAIAGISPRPLLLLHGEQDQIIDVAHAHRLFAAAGEPKTLKTFPGLDHCGAYFVDRPGYIAMVADFIADSTRRA